MKKLLLSLGLLLFLSLSLAGCNDDDAKAQGDDEIGQDLLIDVISGAVLENPEGDDFILELEVSPITIFIDERPGNNSGSINTEDFLENFNEIIGDVPPNAILTYRAEDGTAIAVAVKLNSVVFDTLESVAEFLVTPLDQITNLSPPGTSVELKNIDDVESLFAPALLFIDSITCSSCAGDGTPTPTPIPTPTATPTPCGDSLSTSCNGFCPPGEQCATLNTPSGELLCECLNVAP